MIISLFVLILSVFVYLNFQLPLFSHPGRGGVRQKFAEHMPKICSGCHSVPTHQIFSIDNVFFPQHFQDPPIFFRKCKFFPLKFGDPPTFLWKIHIYQIFDPLTSRPLSVLCSLFCDFCFFLWVFWVFELYKHVKSWKMVHFWCSFSKKDQNLSLMHHGKNLQDHWKNLHFSLFGTHQISICSANFCLTPPR